VDSGLGDGLIQTSVGSTGGCGGFRTEMFWMRGVSYVERLLTEIANLPGALAMDYLQSQHAGCSLQLDRDQKTGR